MKLARMSRSCGPVLFGLIAGLIVVAAARGVSIARASPSATNTYALTYTMQLEPGRDLVRASVTLGDGAERVREIRFSVDPQRHSGFEGDGQIIEAAGKVTWRPPPEGGSLSYGARIDHRRENDGLDAHITNDWALFRGGDIFPPAATRTLKGAQSRARLVLELPEGWSAVTPYRYESNQGDRHYTVNHADRRFDRPTGWILAGQLGVRRATIAGTKVAVAAPRGQGMRRMDILALLRWSLPAIREVFPAMDNRLTIVGANDPMWRGGLSGPGSLYIHADRPLISENGTSTLLHEVVHVAMSAGGAGHDDWVVEGLAEYYTMRVLQRSGTLGPGRMQKTLKGLAAWGDDVDDLFASSANGPVTARATVLMAMLDRELSGLSGGARSLDDVVATIVDEDARYTYASLCRVARQLVDELPASLRRDRVPGASVIASCEAG